MVTKFIVNDIKLIKLLFCTSKAKTYVQFSQNIPIEKI